MAPAATDKFTEVGSPGTATTLAAPGHIIGGVTLNVGSTANWPSATGVIFAIDTVTIVNGVEVRDANSYRECIGVVTSATSIGSVAFLYGSDRNYSAGATTRLYIPVASSMINRLVNGILVSLNQDGTLKTSAVQTALGLGTDALNGWNPMVNLPNTITALGNRSYSLVFNGVDLTSTLSNGVRLKSTRTSTAPTQCTSLNGTTQYYSKSSPAGMTFTNNFVTGGWVKINAYQDQMIISRYNGTSGWRLFINSAGQVVMQAFNAGAANSFEVKSYQSIPLNKWVHVASQMDMTNTTNDTSNNYILIDAVSIPALCTRAGTSPTALVQAGNLEIGGNNGGANPWNGRLAQVFVFSAKVASATMQGYFSQALAGTETSLISAYSFNNSINDLNTTNANNLTANGAAVATNADSPFAQDDDAVPLGTTDFAIIQKATFSTNTTVIAQVPEGCTIPTSGGITSLYYSSQKVPFAFPADRGRWEVLSILKFVGTQTNPVVGTWYNVSSFQIFAPVGAWLASYKVSAYVDRVAAGGVDVYSTLSSANSTEIDSELTCYTYSTNVNAIIAPNAISDKGLRVTTAAPYYLNTKTGQASIVNMQTGTVSSIRLVPATL
jgi:hypothetical protein